MKSRIPRKQKKRQKKLRRALAIRYARAVYQESTVLNQIQANWKKIKQLVNYARGKQDVEAYKTKLGLFIPAFPQPIVDEYGHILDFKVTDIIKKK